MPCSNVGVVVELGARRDLERTHVLGGVHRGEVERPASQPALGGGSPAGIGKSRCHGWLTAPARGCRNRPRRSRSRAEHCSADGGDPRVGDQVDEAAQLLGVDLDVPAVAAAATAPPGRDAPRSKAVIDVLAHELVGPGGANAPLRPMMPSASGRSRSSTRTAGVGAAGPVHGRAVVAGAEWVMLSVPTWHGHVATWHDVARTSPDRTRETRSRSAQDVAEHAGVSVRTVSNVVYGFAQVAPETRARVQASIDELGYRPNRRPGTCAAAAPGWSRWSCPESTRPTSPSWPAHASGQAEQRGPGRCWWSRPTATPPVSARCCTACAARSSTA